jgi:hypothetical protein
MTASLKQSNQVNTLLLTALTKLLFWKAMSGTKMRGCWRTDLAEFRGLTDRERNGFLLVLEWFEI